MSQIISYVSHTKCTKNGQSRFSTICKQDLRKGSLEIERMRVGRSIKLTLIIPSTSLSAEWKTSIFKPNVTTLMDTCRKFVMLQIVNLRKI